MAKTSKIKKRWIPIMAPKLFREQQIGETYILEPEKLVGRNLTVNLMSLTNDIKKQNFSVQFLITQVDNSKAYTKTLGLKMSPAALKRLVRRGKTRLDESFVLAIKDEVIRIKPLIVTRNVVKGSVKFALRQKLIEELTKKICAMNLSDIINEVISTKMQRSMKEILSKVYPLRVFEIRHVKIEKSKNIKVVKAPVEEQKVEEVKTEKKSEEKVENTEKKEEKKEVPKVEEKKVEVKTEAPIEEKKEEVKKEVPVEEKKVEPVKEEAKLETEVEEKKVEEPKEVLESK